MRRRLMKFTSIGLTLLLSFLIMSTSVYAATKPILREGMSNGTVKALQANLKKLGFFSPAATGYYGSATVSAVKKFQRKYNLPVTGVVATLTYNKIDTLLKPAKKTNSLRKPSIPKKTTVQSTQPKSIQIPDGLKLGSTGTEVTKLQSDLKLLGYMKVSATGDFGSITESALIQLQKYYRLDPNGIATPATLSVIGRLTDQTGSSSRGDVNRGEENRSGTYTKATYKPFYQVNLQWIPGVIQAPYLKGVGKYEGVVIHFTANMRDNAQMEADYQKIHWRNAFVHEFIDPNEIIQVADPDYKAFGAGEKANDRFIHLELCHADTLADFNTSFDMITQRAAEYLYQLQLGVSSAKADGTGTLWGHMNVSEYLGGTDHTDPVAYLSSWGVSWDEVISSVTEKYNSLLKGENTDTNETSAVNAGTAGTSVDNAVGSENKTENTDTTETSVENSAAGETTEGNTTAQVTTEGNSTVQETTEGNTIVESPIN